MKQLAAQQKKDQAAHKRQERQEAAKNKEAKKEIAKQTKQATKQLQEDIQSAVKTRKRAQSRVIVDNPIKLQLEVDNSIAAAATALRQGKRTVRLPRHLEGYDVYI